MSFAGDVPFAVLICRGSDAPVDPSLKDGFEVLFATLNVYWTFTSNARINLSGSVVFDGVNLPETSQALVEMGRSQFALRAMQAYALTVNPPDYSQFFGIVAVNVGSGEVGTMGDGRAFFPLQLPPDMHVVTYTHLRFLVCGGVHEFTQQVLAHEMGHTFGLEHSHDRGVEYGDPQDVMSVDRANTFHNGPLSSGPGLNAVNLDRLGWLDPSRIVDVVPTPVEASIELQALNLPNDAGPSVLRLSDTYYVECRMEDYFDQEMNGTGGAVMVHWLEDRHSVLERNPVSGDAYFRFGDVFDSSLSPLPISRSAVPMSLTVDRVDTIKRTASVRYRAVHDGWSAVSYCENRILWLNRDGRVWLCLVMNDGSTSYQEYGPLVGWRPINYQDGRLLWSDNKGSVSLWMFGADGQLSYVEHGPCDGWVPLNYSGGKILWHGGNGHISLWNVDRAGHQVGYKEYGPLKGWVPLNYSDDRLLWRGADGRISLWSLDAAGNKTNYAEHGPFVGWTPLNYNHGRILWRHADGRGSLWKVDAAGNSVSYRDHGPFGGWTPVNYADGKILWRHQHGQISLWWVDEDGDQTSYKEYGPF